MKFSGIIQSFILMVICLNHLNIVVYETGSGEVEINHYECKDYIGYGGNITAPFLGDSATGIVICVYETGSSEVEPPDAK